MCVPACVYMVDVVVNSSFRWGMFGFICPHFFINIIIVYFLFYVHCLGGLLHILL